VPNRQRSEYLRLIEQLSEARDDVTRHGIQAKLQDMINGLLSQCESERLFVERYKRNKASIHLHYSGRERRRDKGFDGCIIVSIAKPDAGGVVIPMEGFAHESISHDGVEMSVFVNVREMMKPTQSYVRLNSVIRLHTLDECVSLFGNPRQVLKIAEGQGQLLSNGRISSCGNFGDQGKSTSLEPCVGEPHSFGVEVDEFERQVIECRPQLIDCFPGENGDFQRGFVSKLYGAFTVGLSGNSTRLISGICEHAVLDSVDMFLCPEDFPSSRVETASHKAESYQIT
jgi:hypothetical protein